jgi:hypothetical protein
MYFHRHKQVTLTNYQACLSKMNLNCKRIHLVSHENWPNKYLIFSSPVKGWWIFWLKSAFMHVHCTLLYRTGAISTGYYTHKHTKNCTSSKLISYSSLRMDVCNGWNKLEELNLTSNQSEETTSPLSPQTIFHLNMEIPVKSLHI